MGIVYKATHPTLRVPVAIKILPAHLALKVEARKRFTREAKAVSVLQHTHIVKVYDYGEADGTAYIVMEYIHGSSLSDFLRAQKRLALPEALPILQDIAAALDYAHAQGLVHRDIKPSNVMLACPTERC